MAGEYDTMDDLAQLLGVETATVRRYRTDSRPGGRYQDRPFPAPEPKKFGQTPVWRRERRDEILAWAAARPGRGVGGGRPRKAADPSNSEQFER